MRRSFASRVTVEISILALFAATFCWFVIRAREDVATIRELQSELQRSRVDRQFPSVGDTVSSLRYRVFTGRDTVELANIAMDKRRIVYFSSRRCAACLLLEAQLDTLAPRWREVTLDVDVDRTTVVSGWRLLRPDGATSSISRIPAAFAIDSAGLVRISSLGSVLGVAKVFSVLDVKFV